jgi:hypothetical protein
VVVMLVAGSTGVLTRGRTGMLTTAGWMLWQLWQLLLGMCEGCVGVPGCVAGVPGLPLSCCLGVVLSLRLKVTKQMPGRGSKAGGGCVKGLWQL